MPVIRTISNQTLGSLESPSSEAMAAAKRARAEIANFGDLSVEKIQFKDLGKTKNGTPGVVLLHEGCGVRFNLTPSDWLSTKYGFDTSCAFGKKPSFLGGEMDEKVDSESLAMRIVLNDETTTFLKEIDEKASEEYKKLCKAEWKSLLAEDTLFGGNASVRINVVLKSKDRSKLSKLTVVQNGKVDRGEGWDFLAEYMDGCNNFRHAEVKVCLRFKQIWHVDGKAGLKLVATRIVLRVTEAPEADPFGDDAELLA